MRIYLFVLFLILSPTTYADSDCIYMHVIDSEPMGFMDENGREHGTHWEFLSKLEIDSGICIKKALYPYKRIWHSLENGQHDAGIIFKSPSREKYVEHSGDFASLKTAVVPFKSVKLDEYEDLYGKAIGIMRGSHLSPKFDNDANLTIVHLSNYKQVAQLVKFGRIDMIAGSAISLLYVLTLHQVVDSVNFESLLELGRKTPSLQFSKKSRHLDKIPALKASIKRLHEDGTFDYIMDKYYGKNWKIVNN